MKLRAALFLAGLALTSPWAAARAQELIPEPAAAPAVQRLLVHNGRIRVGDGAGTVVEALLVEDGRVAAIGPLEQLRAMIGNAAVRELDLAGAVAVPGLQDAHVRLEDLGAALTALEFGSARSEDELVQRVTSAATTLEPGTWIFGGGFDPTRLGVAEWPDARRLDAAAPEHPVLISSADRRAALVNRKALELAKLLPPKDPKARWTPPSGLLRDADGAPTGVLLGEARDLVLALVPKPAADVRIARILAAQEHLLARGVTCIHDMGTALDVLPLYQELLADGRLRLRIVCYLDPAAGIDAVLAAARAHTADPLGRLSVAGVAIQLDGSVGTRGAALLEAYADAAGEQGKLELEHGKLLELVTGAARDGLQPAVLATGDRAARLALDAFRQARLLEPGFARLRPRIEDGLFVTTRDWPRFPELGVALTIAPRSADEAETIALRVGPERWRRSLTWERLAPRLGPVALGSRAPEGEAGPLRSLRMLRFGSQLASGDTEGELSEEPPDGRLALAGCTSAAAWAARQDDRGRLLPGYFADLTVLSVDPAECGADELDSAQVLALLVNGQLIGGEAYARASGR